MWSPLLTLMAATNRKPVVRGNSALPRGTGYVLKSLTQDELIT